VTNRKVLIILLVERCESPNMIYWKLRMNKRERTGQSGERQISRKTLFGLSPNLAEILPNNNQKTS